MHARIQSMTEPMTKEVQVVVETGLIAQAQAEYEAIREQIAEHYQ